MYIHLTLDLYNYFTTGIKKAIANGLDTMGMKSDGTKFPIHLAISEVVDAGFHQFTAIIRDLTPEIEAENYKQSTETQLMWQVDRNGKVLLLNQRFRDYYGITKGQDDSVNVFGEDVVHPNEYQAGVDAFASANRNYKPFSLRRRLKAADGSYRWFLTKAIPVFDIKGKFKQWYGSCTDIDDAVLLEAELKTLQEKLPVLIWKSDPNGELFYGNQQFKEYTGIDFETNKTLFYSDKVNATNIAVLWQGLCRTARGVRKGESEKERPRLQVQTQEQGRQDPMVPRKRIAHPRSKRQAAVVLRSVQRCRRS